jgi:hypothetical protein
LSQSGHVCFAAAAMLQCGVGAAAIAPLRALDVSGCPNISNPPANGDGGIVVIGRLFPQLRTLAVRQGTPLQTEACAAAVMTCLKAVPPTLQRLQHLHVGCTVSSHQRSALVAETFLTTFS